MSDGKFAQLVTAHQDAVLRQMVRVCRDHTDAEDALAEAILAAYKAADQLSDPAAFKAWLAMIARRVCGKMRKREAFQNVWVTLEIAPDELDPSAGLIESIMLKDCLTTALGRLSEPHKRVYVGCELNGKTLAEIADQEGISIGAAKSRLHRARAEIRSAIDELNCQFPD